MQKSIIVTTTEASYRESCNPVFKKWIILPFSSDFVYETLKFVHNNKVLIDNRYKADHCYNTRSKSNFNYLLHKVELFKRSPFYKRIQFYYKGKQFYIKLPEKFKQLNSSKFKSKVYRFFLEKLHWRIFKWLATDTAPTIFLIICISLDLLGA